MKNKIVFTQDVSGEREWIQSQLPGHTNLETSSSGNWPWDFPKDTNQSQLFEIAFSDQVDITKILSADIDCIKSFYRSDPEVKIGRAHV